MRSVVASAMAYMHLSAVSAADKHYSFHTVPYHRMFTPSVFADFISCFAVYARKQQHAQQVIHMSSLPQTWLKFNVCDDRIDCTTV